MQFIADLFDQNGLSETQVLIRVLTLFIGILALFVVVQILFDLVHYLAFRLKIRRSFVPRSWLFVASASFWTLLAPARSEALDQSSSIIISEKEASEKSDSIYQINSLLTCSVVVAGLLLEIGKIRGRHLAKLEAHSRLNHPSAAATLTELSLRAVQNSQFSSQANFVEVLLPPNSSTPVYVPLGISNSQNVFVDLGQGSVVNIRSDDKAEQSSVFNGLIVSALFATKNRLQVIIHVTNSQQPVDFNGISVASSITEVLGLARSSNTNCVVFSREVLHDDEISQLCDNNIAVVCQNTLKSATTEIHAGESSWRLSPGNLSLNPFGLSGEQVATLSDLLSDVVRCTHESTVTREIVSNPKVAFENEIGRAHV